MRLSNYVVISPGTAPAALLTLGRSPIRNYLALSLCVSLFVHGAGGASGTVATTTARAAAVAVAVAAPVRPVCPRSDTPTVESVAETAVDVSANVRSARLCRLSTLS